MYLTEYYIIQVNSLKIFGISLFFNNAFLKFLVLEFLIIQLMYFQILNHGGRVECKNCHVSTFQNDCKKTKDKTRSFNQNKTSECCNNSKMLLL